MNENEHVLTPAQRQKHILEKIRKIKCVDVKSLAREYFINEATIRRDLNKLANTGLVKRTYGGRCLWKAWM